MSLKQGEDGEEPPCGWWISKSKGVESQRSADLKATGDAVMLPRFSPPCALGYLTSEGSFGSGLDPCGRQQPEGHRGCWSP